MTYVSRDVVRQEVRQGSAGPVSVYLTREVTAATFRVLDPAGTERQGTSPAALVQRGQPPRTRLDCTVPTTLDLGLGYELEVTADGELQWLPFDVVLRPIGPVPTLDDVLRVRTQARRSIETAARVLGVGSEEYVVETLGVRARSRLRSMISEQLPSDGNSNLPNRRPWAILDTEGLHRVETLLAIAEHFESVMGGAEDDDAGRLKAIYDDKAQSEMRGLGEFRIDVDGDGVADRAERASGASIRMERVQG